MSVRKRVDVSGIVQGVGFRPYVYRLAAEYDLAGHIINTAAGVTIEVQGEPAAVEQFLHFLPRRAPEISRIIDVRAAEIPCRGGAGFRILASAKSESARTLISPDVALCEDCLRELFDPADRRCGYPFINCTNCGPRFTIVRSIPYDRPATSMSLFAMCAHCQAEYDDPGNRRFHAQPNACWDCGPQVELRARDGRRITADDPITSAGEHLRAGAVVAVKGLGGFHLAADAENGAALERLRERKQRVEKPFAVMVAGLAAAREFCVLEAEDEGLLVTPQRPIVLLERRPGAAVADAVAPRNRQLGIFLPYTPLHHLLFARSGLRALVMTSGNLSEEPIAIGNEEAITRLAGLADFFLVHNRDILLRCDDSVVRRTGGRVRQVRRSRGFVPAPIFLKEDLPAVLAVGGELKNTVCLLKERHAFLSQHIGDLENAESYGFFQEAVEHLQRILEVRPEIIACDLHPDYLSTKWAYEQTGLRLTGVQHHHAHIASCMAENHLEGQVIGLALDGTGYGTDGHIWGGEALVADYVNFERAAHLEYVPLPGGAAAIREPWRMAVSYLWRRYGPRWEALPLPLVREIPAKKITTVVQMIGRGVNSPLTSSAGRLFDAVAALIGLRLEVNYEAQAAIELEMCRDAAEKGAYGFGIAEKNGVIRLDPDPVVEAIVEDVARGTPTGVVSQRFHNGVSVALAEVALRLRHRTGLNRVCLSGGTFQNAFLAEEVERRLQTEGFEVYGQSDVPANDGGLSLGQAVVAAHRAKSA